MLQENIKTFRKERGLTQEELAIRVNVVRQTVSKWEKGRSVPDADLLQRIAEVLEVQVSQLLGEETEMEQNRNEIAEQLSRINEQLAIRNRRSKRLWTAVGVVLAAFLLVQAAVMLSSYIPAASVTTTTNAEVSELYRVLEDAEETTLTITKIED